MPSSPSKKGVAGLGPIASSDDPSIVWAFDPYTSKWTVEAYGQRSTSLKIETLRDKVAGWAATVKASNNPAPEKSSNQAAPTMHIFGLASVSKSYENLDLFNRVDNDEGVVVKTVWSFSSERFEVERYQRQKWPLPKHEKPSGWESVHAKNLWLIDFEALSEADQAWWRQMFRHRQELTVLTEAMLDLGQAWQASKTENTLFYNWRGLPAKRPDKKYSGESVWAVPSDVLFTHDDLKTTVPEQWEERWRQDGNVWRHREWPAVQLRLSKGDYETPQFELWHASESESASLLWQGTSFDVVEDLGHTTAMLHRDDVPVRQQWEYRDQEPLGGRTVWPDLSEIHAARMIRRTRDYRNHADLMMLRRVVAHSPRKFDGFLKEKNVNRWEWVSANTSLSSRWCFFALGPTDEIQPMMLEMAQARDQVIEQIEALKKDLSVIKDRQTQAAIKAQYDRMADGEEIATTSEAAVKVWTHVVKREIEQAKRSPEVMAIVERCERWREQGRATIERAALNEATEVSSAVPRREATRKP